MKYWNKTEQWLICYICTFVISSEHSLSDVLRRVTLRLDVWSPEGTPYGNLWQGSCTGQGYENQWLMSSCGLNSLLSFTSNLLDVIKSWKMFICEYVIHISTWGVWQRKRILITRRSGRSRSLSGRTLNICKSFHRSTKTCNIQKAVTALMDTVNVTQALFINTM